MRKWLKAVVAHALGLPSGLGFDEFKDEITTWSVSNSPRKHHGGGGGHEGGGGISGWLTALIVVIFLAYIGLNLISTFQPTIADLTYGNATSGIGYTIFGLVQTWLLPLALVGLLLYVVMHFLRARAR